MARVHYFLHTKNQVCYERDNEECYAACLDLVDRLKNGLIYMEVGYTLNDVAALERKDDTVTEIESYQYCKVYSKQWIDFLLNLPCYKGAGITCRFIKGARSEYLKGGRYKNLRKSMVKEGKLGVLQIKVDPRNLPGELLFSFLSCMRYMHDYPNYTRNFEKLVSLGFHPYLSFILCQHFDSMVSFDREPHFMEEAYRVYFSMGVGHHTLPRETSLSERLVDVLYKKDYKSLNSKTWEGNFYKLRQIRFFGVKDNLKLHGECPRLSDAMFTRNSGYHGLPSNVIKLQGLYDNLEEVNSYITQLIEGKSRNEIEKPNKKDTCDGRGKLRETLQQVRKSDPTEGTFRELFKGFSTGGVYRRSRRSTVDVRGGRAPNYQLKHRQRH